MYAIFKMNNDEIKNSDEVFMAFNKLYLDK